MKEAGLHFQYQLHFQHLLLGIPFKVYTDHSSLRWLLSQSQVTGLQARYALSRYPDPAGPDYSDAGPAEGNMEVKFHHAVELSSAAGMEPLLHNLRRAAQAPSRLAGRLHAATSRCDKLIRTRMELGHSDPIWSGFSPW